MDKAISFLIGVTAGAALGILLAPAKGTETRRRIREEADRMIDDALSYANQHRNTTEVDRKFKTKKLTKEHEPGQFLD